MSDFIRMSGHYVNVSQMLHMKMTEGTDKDRVDVEVVYPDKTVSFTLIVTTDELGADPTKMLQRATERALRKITNCENVAEYLEESKPDEDDDEA